MDLLKIKPVCINYLSVGADVNFQLSLNRLKMHTRVTQYFTAITDLGNRL